MLERVQQKHVQLTAQYCSRLEALDLKSLDDDVQVDDLMALASFPLLELITINRETVLISQNDAELRERFGFIVGNQRERNKEERERKETNKLRGVFPI